MKAIFSCAFLSYHHLFHSYISSSFIPTYFQFEEHYANTVAYTEKCHCTLTLFVHILTPSSIRISDNVVESLIVNETKWTELYLFRHFLF